MPRVVWVALLALSLVIFGWRINSTPLTNWDEGIYANVNLELFRSQDWTKLTYFGADFLEKPPLQFWATFPLIGILGPTELAIRLWSVVAGIGTVLLLGVWTWQATRKKIPALLVGVMFALGRFALIHVFRTGDLDGLMTFFITLAMYAYWRSPGAPRWMFMWGAASAAAVMTKSVAGLVPVIVVGADLLLTRGWRKIGWGNIVWGIVAFLTLAAPWHIVESLRFGRAFWDSYLGLHVIERTTESLFTKTPWYWYLGIIRDRFFPFSFLVPLALWSAWQQWRREHDDLRRIAVLWSVTVLCIFTIIQTRREWYIIALYPALVLLLGITVVRWWERQSRWVMAVFVMSLVVLFAHLLTDHHLLALLGHLPGVRTLSSGWWVTITGRIAFGLIATGLVFGLAYVLRAWRYGWWRWSVLISGGAMFALALGWSVQYIRSQPTSLPLKTISTRVAQENPLRLDLAGTKLKKEPAGYFYLLRLDTHSTELPAGQIPRTPLFLTTNEAKNAPLNTEGRALVKEGKFLLLDLR